MPKWERDLNLKYLFKDARPYLYDASALRRYLDGIVFTPTAVGIAEIHPEKAYAGTAMVLIGHGFSEARADNHVEVGGKPAFVVEASPSKLLVLTDATCGSGPVKVTVAGHTATAPADFVCKPWPTPGSRDEAPPYSFEGRGMPGGGGGGGPSPGGAPSAGTIPPTGTARVLVILTYPTDLVPPHPADTRTNVVNTFGNVTTFYDQVSYGTLDVQVDVTTFIPLLQNRDYYHRQNGAASYPNIDNEVLDQLSAEAAQGAVDQGFDLDDYAVMTVLVYMPGFEVRAWGGWTRQNFTYNDGAGTAINLTAANPLSMIVARHDADWGRAAHEFGHNLVDGGMVLGEDIYDSDLVDPSQATAQELDLMGAHDDHPMYSGFYMQQLGYYSAANILELQWDRNPFQQEYDIVAHGDAVDTIVNRYNLIRIKVSPGLDYYVEVRQRPPAGSTQIYDANIPLPGGTTRTGGVVVTKAISGTVDNNQQMRLISLLHDPTVLLTSGVATDPLRGLKITVVNDQVSQNPLVCRVRVEWAQQIADTPGGDFDLWVTPWGAGWETPDIWIDRQPFGTYDFTDTTGNPTGNGDEPRPMEINHFWARVSNTGAASASDVRLTFYVVTPPGVGDNGTWTPIQTKVIANVPNGGSGTAYVSWIPTVGEHTCLKVMAEQQFGEVSGGNNGAQENVFNFQPAAHSVPEPVSMPVAIRNPLDKEAIVQIGLDGVPAGYRVYLPHRWVFLPPKGEEKMELLMVPIADLEVLRAQIARASKLDKKRDGAPRMRVTGWIERGYTKKVAKTGVPGSWMRSIGGITSRVEPKRLGQIKMGEDPKVEKPAEIGLLGRVEPPLAGQALRVDLRGSDGSERFQIVTTGERGEFRARFEVKKGGRPPVVLERTPAEVTGPHIVVRERPEVTSPHIVPRESPAGGLPHIVPRGGVQPPERAKIQYRAQAHVFNAKDLAPADSNVVILARPA